MDNYFYNLESRESKEVVAGVQLRTFWGKEIMLSFVDLAPNSSVPNHSHPHEQAGTVISGEIELTINGDKRSLKPGDAYVIPGGVEHSADTGDLPARVLDIFSPVRDDYKY